MTYTSYNSEWEFHGILYVQHLAQHQHKGDLIHSSLNQRCHFVVSSNTGFEYGNELFQIPSQSYILGTASITARGHVTLSALLQAVFEVNRDCS